MPSVKSILEYTYLNLLYDFFILSVKITFAMTAATFKLIIPPRAKNLLGETVLVNKMDWLLVLQLQHLICICYSIR